MTDVVLVFLVLAVTIALFVSDRLRLDLVALLSLLTLALTGILTPAEALAGFADPLVITIAGLFVVSGALFETGLAARLGRWLGRVAGGSETRTLLLVMIVTALLSGVMSSTGTVAVMLPVVVSLAWRARISPSKLLIPLSFASLLGGMLTLIGTPPNLVVSNALRDAGLAPFRFFDFAPVGLAMLAVGIVFLATVGRSLLPARAPAEPRHTADDSVTLPALMGAHGAWDTLVRLDLPAGSPLAGRTLAEGALRSRYGVTILGITSPARPHAPSRSLEPRTTLRAGDRLWVQGPADDVRRLAAAEGLTAVNDDTNAFPENLGVAEVLLPPRSRLIGRSLRDARFRDRFRVTVLGVKRLGERVAGDIASLPLAFGDTLLVKGPWERIHALRDEGRDFVVIAEPADTQREAARRAHAPVALVIMIGMLAAMTLEIVPVVVAVGAAAVLMVLFGCLHMEEAYRSINWESVVLIAAILPMATALAKTGGLDLMTGGVTAVVGDAGPVAMLAGLFVLTSLLSQVISNTATAVLLAPVAIQAAATLEVAPHAFLMAVAIAASTAFSTPVASPVNTLVLGPGAYRFGDFLRVGALLQALVFAAALVIIPLLFPF